MFSDDAQAKFFDRVDVREEDDGCWRWVGSATPAGYGMFRPVPGPKKVYAHRWSQEMWNTPIPRGWQVDHLCENPWCVNPEHLESVTPRENVRRAWNWTRDEDGNLFCQRGHNLGRQESGACKECEALAVGRYKQRRADAGDPVRYIKNREQRRRDEERAAERRREKALRERPELTESEVDRLGLHTIAQRFRRNWTFDGELWYKSDGSVADDLAAGS